MLEDECRKLGVHHRPFAAVETHRADGRTGRDAQHRPVLDAVWRHRGHGGRPRGGVRRRHGHAHQERAAPRRRPGHPPRRDRQRRRALLHHRSHGKAVPVPAAEQHVRRLDAEEHAHRLRGAARGDGRRLQAVGRAPLRSAGRRVPFLEVRREGRLRAAVHGRGPGRRRQGDDRGHQGAGREVPGVQAGGRRTTSRSGSPTSTGAPDKIANERKEIVATRTMGRTTEVSADWSTICDIYENALQAAQGGRAGHHRGRRALLAQLHQRHQHVLHLLLQRELPARAGSRQVPHRRSTA